MCALLQTDFSDRTVDVLDGEFAVAALERRSVLPGYCVVMWRHRHVAQPTELTPAEASGYWREVLDVARAVRTLFNPVKLNFLTLGNSVPHLHTHVLPRYHDDPAAGGPISWEAIFSTESVPEAQLESQAAELRQFLAQ